MSRDLAFICDMRNAALCIAEFIMGMDRDAFERDAKTQSAVLHQIMVLGEAAGRVSERFQQEHAKIPWRLIVGMRNRLIHGYDDVDFDEVWFTATRDVPSLLEQLALLNLDAR